MEMIIIATFFSHFGAVRFKKQCDETGWKAQLKPVPRTLSSSCGTCVEYSVSPGRADSHEADRLVLSRTETEEPAERLLPKGFCRDEVEQAVEVTPDGYLWIYKAEGI